MCRRRRARHPAQALAIADVLGAILVIALFYGHGLALDALLYGAGILVIMITMNLARIYARAPYLLLGILLWYFILKSGVHATLAGVLVALMIPARPSINARGFALHARQIIDNEIASDDQEIGAHAMQRLGQAVSRLREPGFHLQHALENWSSFLILPLFAFANTGVALTAGSFSLATPESLGVMAGLLIGKPLGITLAVWLAVKTGRTKLSEDINWPQLIGAATLCGVGFTMSIFISTAAFDGAQLASVKVSVLAASTLAAIVGATILMISKQGRKNPA
ncbi:MAG: Na+/H+ antiporter NhaA [Pseudomonadota bacterium]